MDSLQWLTHFHLLRPYWLLALIPLALVLWLYGRNQAHSHSWASVVDQKLLPHLLQGTASKTKAVPLRLLFFLGALLIIALSGPAFEKRPQPVFKAKSALVILLDLSRSMDATDIKPSRLSRAHFKINDILKLRKEGQTALITYAADAFTVSPLTEDANTISAQIPALETHIMPNQGSRLDIALEKAQQLFTNAGHSKGHILVITDSINAQASAKIKQLEPNSFKTSILAIGTEEGAPIAAHNGGFVKDRSGSIVVPKLDIQSLKHAAKTGGGNFSLLTSGDRDINRLLSGIDIDKLNKGTNQMGEQLDASGNAFKTDTWHEEGPWLLLLVLPFAAYAFRRGLVFALLIFILPLPQPAQAIEWDALWKNTNQRAAQALEKGDSEKAAELFNDPQWKAAAEYRAGNYQQSADLLGDIDNADAHYNRGNALAKAGQLEDAISAYERALKQQPDHADAQHNKQLVNQALQQQEQQQNQDSEQQDSGDSQQQKPQESIQQESEQQDSQQQGSQNDSSQNNQDNSEESNASSAENNNENQDQQSEQQAEPSQQDAEQEPESQQERQQSELQNEQQEDQQAMQESASEAEPDLDQQQTQQWLKKIPDDPGGLLRRKFKYQYGQDKKPTNDDPW